MAEIHEQASGLWTIDHPLKLGAMEMGTRTTLVRLASGGIVVHSPGPLGGGLADEISKLGDVVAIIAPNCFHYFYVSENAEAFSAATVYGAAGLVTRQPDLPIAETLTNEAPALLRADLEQHCVEGAPRMGEVVFFHPASRTLLLTDIAFNIHSQPSALGRFALRLLGVWDRFGPSRYARSMWKDKAALRRSLDRTLEWDFDRVTVTHGDVVATGGKALFREAYAGLPG